MDKKTIATFNYEWFKTHSIEEILEHKDFCEQALKLVSNEEAKSDIRLAIRLIEEDLALKYGETFDQKRNKA